MHNIELNNRSIITDFLSHSTAFSLPIIAYMLSVRSLDKT